MKNSNVDTIMKCLLAFCLAALILLPYAVGRVQYEGARVCMQVADAATDGEIESTLTAYNFNIAWHESPTFADYWIAGYKTKF